MDNSPDAVVFRPLPARIVALGVALLGASSVTISAYTKTHTVLDALIALGLDPTRSASFVTFSLVSVGILWVSAVVLVCRRLLPTGELRIVGSTVVITTGSFTDRHDIRDLLELSCHRNGANLQLRFPTRVVRLPGQWLPVGWSRTCTGWQSLGGESVKELTVATHPLPGIILGFRPDINVRVRGLAALLLQPASGYLALAAVVAIFCDHLPGLALNAELRRQHARPDITAMAGREFQSGRYERACEVCRSALPNLRNDLYGSQTAAEYLTYCGDLKSAVQAVLGFDGQLLWPSPMGPAELARIFIAQERFAKAETLLRGSGYDQLLATALDEQGRTSEADDVRQRHARHLGLAHVILLRHQGSANLARDAAEVACSKAIARKAPAPSALAIDFKICLVAGGSDALRKDPRFLGAVRAFPALRTELLRFAEREDLESVDALRVLIRDAVGAPEAPPERR